MDTKKHLWYDNPPWMDHIIDSLRYARLPRNPHLEGSFNHHLHELNRMSHELAMLPIESFKIDMNICPLPPNFSSLIKPKMENKEFKQLSEQHQQLGFYGTSLQQNEDTLGAAKYIAQLLTEGQPNVDFTGLELVVHTNNDRRVHGLHVAVKNNTRSLPLVVEAAKTFLEALRQATLAEVTANAEAVAVAAGELHQFVARQSGETK